MLQDEILSDISQVGHTITNTLEKAYNIGQQLYALIKSREGQSVATSDLPFVFTGQITDLDYFRQNDVLPRAAIEAIPDERLKSAVISNFEIAEKEGLINVDLVSETITLTDKGKEYINKPDFISAANENRRYAYEQRVGRLDDIERTTTRYTVELNGTDRDLQFFNFASSLDLSEVVASTDKDTATKILANFSQWENKGYAKMSDNKQFLQLTEKGYQRLKETMQTGEKLAEKVKTASAATDGATASTGVGVAVVVTRAVSEGLKKMSDMALNRK